MAKNAEELAEPAEVDLPLRVSENFQGNILAPFNKPYQRFLFISFMNRPQQAGTGSGISSAAEWRRRARWSSTTRPTSGRPRKKGHPPAAVGRGELHVLRAADPGCRPGERPAGLRRLPAG